MRGKGKKIACIILGLIILASAAAFAILPAVIPLVIFASEAYTVLSLSVTTSATLSDVIAQKVWHNEVENTFNDQIQRIDDRLNERQQLLKDNPALYYERGYDKQDPLLAEERLQLQNMLYYSKEGNIIDMRERATEGSLDMLSGALKGIIVTQLPAVVLKEMGYISEAGAKITEALLGHATSLSQDIPKAVEGAKQAPELIRAFTGTPRTPDECESKYNALMQKTSEEYDLKIAEVSSAMNSMPVDDMVACLPGPGADMSDVENDPACREIVQKRKDIDSLKAEKESELQDLKAEMESCKTTLANAIMSDAEKICAAEIGDTRTNCEEILKKDMGYLICTSCIDLKEKGIPLPSSVPKGACGTLYAKPTKEECEDIFGMTGCLRGEQDKYTTCLSRYNT